jgi:hypothetical protein
VQFGLPLVGPDTKTGTATWDSTTRELRIDSGTVTLGGVLGGAVTSRAYRLCKLTINGGTLTAGSLLGAAQIYIDSPANCGLSPGATQVTIASSGAIAPSAANKIQIYMTGASTPSLVNISSSATNRFVLYAPQSNVTMSNGTVNGSISAKQLSLSGSAHLAAVTSETASISLPFGPLYQRQRVVDCQSPDSMTSGQRGGLATSPDDLC